MIARRTSPRAVIRDRRGATIVEFAIVFPVMMMAIMGLGEILFQEYVQSVLSGAVQKAGRDSGIQGGADQTATIDAAVISMVGTLIQSPTQNCSGNASTATWCSTRKNYDTFTEVAPEPLVSDANSNGKCDPGDTYLDENGNKQWDADPGAAGQGGASAVTLYTMTITYPRLFPVAKLLGFSATATLADSTLLKNQPYSVQTTTATVVRPC